MTVTREVDLAIGPHIQNVQTYRGPIDYFVMTNIKKKV